MVQGIDHSSVSPSSCHPHSYRARLCGVHSSIGTCTAFVDLQLRYCGGSSRRPYQAGVVVPVRVGATKEAPSFEHAHTLSRSMSAPVMRRDVIR